MAINWDKEYGTSEPNKSKINWEKEYNPTGFKEKIDNEKADLRSKGLPVSVRDDRSTPTMGGSILRDILKVPATLLVRPGQALAATKGFTPEEQTVKSKYLGDIKTSQNKKDVLSDVGRGLELASYGVGIGAGKNILAQSGKQTAKQIAKRTAIEGAVGGFAGSGGRVITNQSGNLKQDLKDIALGTGIGTVAGGALGYAGGRLGGKVLSAEERAMERAVGKGGKFNIPGVTTPKVTEIPKIETPVNNLDPKNFKSAEEFVKAQGTPVYRGEGGSNVAQGKALLAEGKHFASDAEYPKGFGKVSENVLKPDAKVLDLGDSTFPEISEKLGIPKKNYISPKELSAIAKEKGYDVLKYNGTYKSSGKQFTHFVDLTGDSTIPKSQLTDIWNKVNKKVEIEPLIQEAKKYKSAEEFVKAQPTVYHGTQAKFDKFDLKKAGSATDSGMYGKGFYFTPSKAEAYNYSRGTGNIKEVYLDLKNPYIINSGKDIPDIKVPNKTIKDMKNSAVNYSEMFTKYLKDKGYDGVIDNMSVNKQYVVFDPKQIKTKSQLTDIWNKVNQPIPEQSPITKTPEFKTKVTEGETVLDNHYNNPDASPGSHKLYSETVYNDIANDPERVKRIAMGSNEATTNGVPADAYYAIAKNEAVKSGDVQAMKDLANSNVGSISGQKLEANKLTQEGDIIDTLRDIKKARAKAVGVSEEAIKKQETTFVQKLKVSVKNLSDDIINDLICK